MKEREMYPEIRKFMKRNEYEAIPRKVRFRYSKKHIGQAFIELDVIGCRDDIVWIVECKNKCTIEQFGFALGQLLCYKMLFDIEPNRLSKKVGRDVRNAKYSVGLLDTQDYPLTRELIETFRSIVNQYGFTLGLLKMDEKSKEVEELPFASP